MRNIISAVNLADPFDAYSFYGFFDWVLRGFDWVVCPRRQYILPSCRSRFLIVNNDNNYDFTIKDSVSD